MWCTDRGCRFQESPIHSCLGNFKMLQCVIFKHVRAQLCREHLVCHWDHGLARRTPGVPKFWASDCGVRRSGAGGWHGEISECLFYRKPALSRNLGSCSSWQHLLGASAPSQPYKWSWRRCWDHEFGMKAGGSKGVECASLPPKRLLKKKLCSLRRRQLANSVFIKIIQVIFHIQCHQPGLTHREMIDLKMPRGHSHNRAFQIQPCSWFLMVGILFCSFPHFLGLTRLLNLLCFSTDQRLPSASLWSFRCLWDPSPKLQWETPLKMSIRGTSHFIPSLITSIQVVWKIN